MKKKDMKKREKFIDELKKAVDELMGMKPGEIHVLSVNANYGRYEIVIGPKGNAGKTNTEERPIEINGEIHHLFLTPRNISAMPSQNQIMDNLKDTVIVRGLSIHIRDPKGDGEHVAHGGNGDNGIHIHEYINLAGDRGKNLIHNAEHDEMMSLAAYQIIQEDILQALKEKKRTKESHH
jgi:hypothetical protein